MANGLTVLMMCYLLSCRRKNRESLHTEDKVYDGIAKVNILGAVAETISFLVDGKSFIGLHLSYIWLTACIWCIIRESRELV